MQRPSFRQGLKGYSRGDVDAMVDKLERMRTQGYPIAQYARNATFRMTLRGYDVSEVDAYLATLSTLPHVEGAQLPNWQEFCHLPGPHLELRKRRPWDRVSELVGSDGGVLCSNRKSTLYSPRQILVGGRTYEEHVAGKRSSGVTRVPREIVDVATGERILGIEGVNYNRQANGFVESRFHQYAFPVVGKPRKQAVMTVLDESGSAVAWIRYAPSPFWDRQIDTGELIISPDEELNVDLLCVAAVATSFLWLFFASPGGGGG
jgi:DivIVA domain-containing protein